MDAASADAALGFSDLAALDEGAMWATGFALAEVTAEVEARIAGLVKRAARRTAV